MRDTLHFLISSMVDDPTQVKVDEAEEGGIVNFTVSVAKDDMGKVIGKEGKVIKALRNIMRIPGVVENKKIYITLAEV